MLPKAFPVRITERHISEGTPFHCLSCPLSLAVWEELKYTFGLHGVTEVSVTLDDVVVYAGDERVVYSHDGGGFISNFDNERYVSPTVVNLTRI